MPTFRPPATPPLPSIDTSLDEEHLKLPPFCSPHPQPIPVSREISELDLNALDTSTQKSLHPTHNHGTNTPTTLTDALPSLISPAFTPPSTPSTPNLSLPHHLPPRSIPVDSTLRNGGCGPKKPRLLQCLPEVRCIVRARIPTTTGTEMFLHLYQNSEDNKEHLAIVFGNAIRSSSLDAPREGETEMDRLIRGAYRGRLWPGRTDSRIVAEGEEGGDVVSGKGGRKVAPLVRIHSECYTGETVWSARCDCGEQLDEAARLMSLPDVSGGADAPGGVIIYLRQEGRGIGLGEKLKAYNLQDLGSDTVEANLLLRHPADARSYGLATAMLVDLGVKEVRLLTNNPEKIRAIEGPGREVVVRERVAMIPLAWRHSRVLRGKEGDIAGDVTPESGVSLGRKQGIRSQEIGGYLRTKVCVVFLHSLSVLGACLGLERTSH